MMDVGAIVLVGLPECDRVFGARVSDGDRIGKGGFCTKRIDYWHRFWLNPPLQDGGWLDAIVPGKILVMAIEFVGAGLADIPAQKQITSQQNPP